jgi:hypothetical protein
VSELPFSLVVVALLAVLHVLAGRIHRLYFRKASGAATARPRWLSAASGISIAYVFVRLLPELGEVQSRWLEAHTKRPLWWLESQIYVVALFGLLFALGIARTIDSPGHERRHFRARAGSLAVYNVLVGALIHHMHGGVTLMLALLAFGAHLFVNDHALRSEHGRECERVGRWLLASAIVAGWLIAELWRPPLTVAAVFMGLVSGGIILNVLAEEIPKEHEGSFVALVGGALAYSALLLALVFGEHVA